jgi:5-methylcytosine-specific restriction endonuclease McrA
MASADPRYHTPAWTALRIYVLDRDQWRCQIRMKDCTHVATCVDHIDPAVEGGSFYDPHNVRASCTGCNARRGLSLAMKRSKRYRYRTSLAPTQTRF